MNDINIERAPKGHKGKFRWREKITNKFHQFPSFCAAFIHSSRHYDYGCMYIYILIMARSKGQEFFFFILFYYYFLHLSILIVNLRIDSFASNIIAFIAKHFFVSYVRTKKKIINPQKNNKK